MASVTKVITAAAILQLVQNGSLDLDGKLSDYLPGFVLLALVIENASGLPCHIYFRENILEPLTMKKSFFGNEADGVDLTGSYTMFSDDEHEEMPINYIAAGA